MHILNFKQCSAIFKYQGNKCSWDTYYVLHSRQLTVEGGGCLTFSDIFNIFLGLSIAPTSDQKLKHIVAVRGHWGFVPLFLISCNIFLWKVQEVQKKSEKLRHPPPSTVNYRLCISAAFVPLKIAEYCLKFGIVCI